MSLLDYESKFTSMNLNKRRDGGRSPHKVAMLLSVMQLIDKGIIKENAILFDENLLTEFTHQFSFLARENDQNSPYLPYFHLRSDGFWHHRIKPGKTKVYGELSKASSAAVIREIIEYAYLDDELFELLSNDFVRQFLKSSLINNLAAEDQRALLQSGNSWDWLECELVVKDYFDMLMKELKGIAFKKSEHRKNLLPKLNNRSVGAVEFKHQNISAVLVEMGQPYIVGYKPAFNYQGLLKDVVLAYFAGNGDALEYFSTEADLPAVVDYSSVNWRGVYDAEVPEILTGYPKSERSYIARKTNFAAREQLNRTLGLNGESFVLDFERYRLTSLGRDDLAQEVVWASSEEGDGLGYDIRSYNAETEKELFIEVKTTRSGKYSPFYITENEVMFSREYSSQYSLYRVYQFSDSPKLFRLDGAVDKNAHLQPQVYKAAFNTLS